MSDFVVLQKLYCGYVICCCTIPRAVCLDGPSKSTIHYNACAGYLCQYWPTFGIWVMKKIGPLRAAQLKSGGSGYDFVSMVFGKARTKRD